MNTLNVTIEDAKAASAAIVKYLKPRSIVLFGSVAREGRGSDLDLLVVTDEASNQSENGDLLLHRCLRRYHKRFPIDSFIVPLAKLNAGFRRGSPFLHMIAREGRTLYMRDGRYPIDRGLLPLGEPEEGDAARAVEIATRILPPRKTLNLKT